MYIDIVMYRYYNQLHLLGLCNMLNNARHKSHRLAALSIEHKGVVCWFFPTCMQIMSK